MPGRLPPGCRSPAGPPSDHVAAPPCARPQGGHHHQARQHGIPGKICEAFVRQAAAGASQPRVAPRAALNRSVGVPAGTKWPLPPPNLCCPPHPLPLSLCCPCPATPAALSKHCVCGRRAQCCASQRAQTHAAPPDRKKDAQRAGRQARPTCCTGAWLTAARAPIVPRPTWCRLVLFPTELVFVYRVAALLKGLSLALQFNIGVGDRWKEYARAALEADGAP